MQAIAVRVVWEIAVKVAPAIAVRVVWEIAVRVVRVIVARAVRVTGVKLVPVIVLRLERVTGQGGAGKGVVAGQAGLTHARRSIRVNHARVHKRPAIVAHQVAHR